MGYTLLNRDDPSIESFRGAFYKMRKALGATAFGINEIHLPPNTPGVEHDEQDTGHEEVYVVIEGTGRSRSTARTSTCRPATTFASTPTRRGRRRW
jgi:uncharacterized cupin superfamily protein